MALRIKEIAKAKGITMGEIADKMGINPVNLSASLNGNPTLNRLQEVAVILGVEVPDLFAQDSSYLNGHIETGNNIYSVKSREQFIGIISKIDGIVHIPLCQREDVLKNSVKDFCARSVESNMSGAIMNRYGVNEVFTLSYDSDSKKFSLTLCIGDGNVKFRLFDTDEYKKEDSFTSPEMNRMIEDVLSCIESIYEDRIVDTENNKVRLTNLE
jgi:transcriptional regulator with XRE-family HTH domain